MMIKLQLKMIKRMKKQKTTKLQQKTIKKMRRQRMMINL